MDAGVASVPAYFRPPQLTIGATNFNCTSRTANTLTGCVGTPAESMGRCSLFRCIMATVNMAANRTMASHRRSKSWGMR